MGLGVNALPNLRQHARLSDTPTHDVPRCGLANPAKFAAAFVEGIPANVFFERPDPWNDLHHREPRCV